MITKTLGRSHLSALLAGAFLTVASLLPAHAVTTLTFSVDMATNIANGTFTPGTDTVYCQGTFNNWSPFLQLFQQGSSTVFTNTTDNTGEAGGPVTKYQFVRRNSGTDTYETSAASNLRAALLPAGGGSLILPTPFFNDAGAAINPNVTFSVDMSQQIALGIFTNGSSSVEVRGNFNGWTGGANVLTWNPSVLRTNQYGLVTANVYTNTIACVASTNAAMDFKYVITYGGFTGWDAPTAVNSDNGGNRFFVNNVSKSLPVVDFSDQPFAPISQVRFSLDMSAVLLTDPGFIPGSVVLDGSFNSWSADVACTNNPTAANTNIYSTVLAIGAGSTINYQFRYNNGSTQYDHAPNGNNRVYTAQNIASTNLPTVFFNNVMLGDLLNVDTLVTFSVSMTNAVGTDAHTFDPNNDLVFINGDFAGWVAWSPIALTTAGLTCGNNPAGSQVYTFQKTFLKNQSRFVDYKYSINGADNEAGFGQDHGRYIRSTNGVYTLPLDTFGNQYREPKFGNLAIGRPVAGALPVTWLGYPGVNLQTSSSLNGSWANVPNTDSQSSTNWPSTGGIKFFRLIQP